MKPKTSYMCYKPILAKPSVLPHFALKKYAKAMLWLREKPKFCVWEFQSTEGMTEVVRAWFCYGVDERIGQISYHGSMFVNFPIKRNRFRKKFEGVSRALPSLACIYWAVTQQLTLCRLIVLPVSCGIFVSVLFISLGKNFSFKILFE